MRRAAGFWRWAGPLGLASLLSCGCGDAEPPQRTEAARAARAQALIEAGNDAYRAGDYRLAAKRYAAAAVVRKDDPAAYFGMGMALSKLGRQEEAHAAYQRSRELARKP
jgi:Flp pilus assembly protein TadD